MMPQLTTQPNLFLIPVVEALVGVEIILELMVVVVEIILNKLEEDS